jgi:hypothetical protein
MAQRVYKMQKGNLSVLISRNTDSETGAFWYSVTPSRCSQEGDDSWNETTDSIGFDGLLTTAADLVRRADDLPIAGTEHERRAADLRVMAWLLGLAHEKIAELHLTDASPRSASSFIS